MLNKELSQSKVEIPIMHCFDNNYVIPAAVSFYSMLKYASTEYHYKLFVLHTDITSQNQKLLSNVVEKFSNASIHFLNMDNEFSDLWNKMNFVGHYSKEVLYKLLVASIFPQYDKLIITDVDVVYSGDISSSYFLLDIEEPVCFAGVHQVCPRGTFLESFYDGYEDDFPAGTAKQLKVCGGYLVANLKYMREHDKENEFVEYLSANAYRLRQAEQDVINFCCSESEIKYLPLANVVCTYMYDIFSNEKYLDADMFYTSAELLEAMEKPIQIHYATGIKPWKDVLATKADLWFSYLIESGFYYEYMKKMVAENKESPVIVDIKTLGEGWRPNNSAITVSVLCCTYNHEKYIRQALNGIVGQKVKFKYEIIVADDASTDRTQEIIKEYCEKYPELFIGILREANLGIGQNYYDALQHVRGKYLAICDGDDYWTDPYKLQRQVDYMESHPICTVCCSSFVRHEYSNSGFKEEPFNVENYIKTTLLNKEFYTFQDLLYCRFVASCTVMFRWQFKQRVPEFIQNYSIIDFPLALLHAAGGTINVIENYYPAVYNVHNRGVTKSSSSSKFVNDCNMILKEVDQYLDYRFSNQIKSYFDYLKTGVRPSILDNSINVQELVEAVQEYQEPSLPIKILGNIYRRYMPEIGKKVFRKTRSIYRKLKK